MPEMDTAAFAKWLAGIGLLGSTQRGQAFRALALAEAIDPIEWSDQPIDDPAPPGAAEAAPSIMAATTVGAAPDEGLLSKIGRDRIASFAGLRALVVRIAAGMTFVPGATPAASLGTAAPTAARPSIR